MPRADRRPDPAVSQLLYATFSTALDKGYGPAEAEAFGVWTLCFVRYCNGRNVPANAARVPGFLAYLRDRPDVTREDKDRALDAVMFALFDVFDGKVEMGAVPKPAQESDVSQEEAPDAPEGSSAGRLLAQLLFHTDLALSEAVRLKASHVEADRSLLRFGRGDDVRIVPLPEHLRGDAIRHARIAEREAGASAPLFPAAYEKYVSPSSQPEWGTQTATRVMQTLFMSAD
jgi:integrase